MNLYRDQDGNFVKGRYIYKLKNQKYAAYMKYPQGYRKSGTFYSLEDAVTWIEGNWTRYEPGWYYDDNMKMITLRRPGEPSIRREF